MNAPNQRINKTPSEWQRVLSAGGSLNIPGQSQRRRLLAAKPQVTDRAMCLRFRAELRTHNWDAGSRFRGLGFSSLTRQAKLVRWRGAFKHNRTCCRLARLRPRGTCIRAFARCKSETQPGPGIVSTVEMARCGSAGTVI